MNEPPFFVSKPTAHDKAARRKISALKALIFMPPLGGHAPF